MGEKPKVGLLGLMLELYDGPFPQLKGTMHEFAQSIVGALSNRLQITFPGVCMRTSEVESALGQFEAEGCDMVMVVCLTYSPSLVSVPALLRSHLPLVIFDTAKAPEVGKYISWHRCITSIRKVFMKFFFNTFPGYGTFHPPLFSA